MTQHYLSRAEFAERIGVKPATMGRYKLPEPDVMIGSTRGWSAETVDAWHAARPGRGKRAEPQDTTITLARDLKPGMRIVVKDEEHVIDVISDERDDMFVYTKEGLTFYFTPKQKMVTVLEDSDDHA